MSTLVDPERVDDAYGEIAALIPQHDIELAKKEMAQSTVPDGVSTEVLVVGSDPNLSAITQTVAQEAAKVGIDIKVKEVDDNTYYNAIYFKHKTKGLGLDTFGAQGPDPSNLVVNALSSDRALPEGSGINVSNYRSDAVDKSIAASKVLKVDDSERGEHLMDAQLQAAKDLPFVPVAWPKVYSALSGMTYEDWNTFWFMADWPRQLRSGG
jgi:peptide/nickel transport system substrate-binding protein